MGGWSVGIENCCQVRGEQVDEILRGEAMQTFDDKEREREREREIES